MLHLLVSRVLVISSRARVGATEDVEAGCAVVPPDGPKVTITGVVDALWVGIFTDVIT